jgi:hypothetical protein
VGPTIYDGMMVEVPTPHYPGYHFMTDMTDQAIAWMKFQKALTPDKPFFIYFAPGATHAPHHVPKEWIAKYKGKFDGAGTSCARRRWRARSRWAWCRRARSWPNKPEAIKDWDKLTADEKKLFTRQMEVYAGFGEYTTTRSAGCSMPSRDRPVRQHAVFYILGDNGTSAEGGMNGMFSEMTYFNGVQETVAGHAQALRRVGRADDLSAHGRRLGRRGRHALHVDQAGRLQLRRHPQRHDRLTGPRHQGRQRDALAVAPRHRRGPHRARGREACPSRRASTARPDADRRREHALHLRRRPSRRARHKTQYFEIFGNRAIYHDGWFAGTVHKAPWETKPRAKLLEDKWELYDTRKDFSLANDLAAKQPGEAQGDAGPLHEGGDQVPRAAHRRPQRRARQRRDGRPARPDGRPHLAHALEGMDSMSENVFINIKNRSLSITADVEIPEGGANGVILAQGGRFGGWSLYLKDGKPTYTYNFLGLAGIQGRRPAGGAAGQGHHPHELRL